MRKNIALILALVMLLSMVPMVAFAVDTENPTTYNTGAVPRVVADDDVVFAGPVRVSVKVSKDFNLVPVTGIQGFVSLPSNVTADAYLVAGKGWNIPEGTEVPLGSGRNFNLNFGGLGVETVPASGDDVTFFVDFYNIDVASRFTGSQVVAEFEFNKFFRGSDIVIANVVEEDLAIMMEDIFFISDADIVNDIGGIRITENIAGSNQNIELKLPRGFYWDETVTEVDVSPRFGMPAGTQTVDVVYLDNVDNIRNQYRTARILLRDLTVSTTERSSYIIDEGQLRIRVDALRNPEKGDVVADVDGADPSELVIARYGSYLATPEAREVRNLFAGQLGRLGRFEIQEDVADSLAARRTVTLTLPVGVKWHVTPEAIDTGGETDWWIEAILSALGVDPLGFRNFDQGVLPQLRNESVPRGLEFIEDDNDNIRWQFVDAERRTIRATIETESDTTGTREGALLVFDRSQVVVEAGYRGPIEVEVGGSAGAAGTITLAQVYPAVEVEAAAVADVIVGAQDQELADITITETFAGAAERTDAMTGIITLRVPEVRNAVFSRTPVAEVVDGDMMIERVWMSSDRRAVNIQVQGESDEASSIELSNLALTFDRTAPEGELHLEIAGDAIIDAVTWVRYNFFQSDVLDTVVVANVLDVAPLRDDVEGAVVSFTIGQSSYVVNGETMMMDVAPFISNDRTMVPVRYLEDIFGSKPMWNADTRTVSIRFDGDLYSMTVGDNMMYINGQAVERMDASVVIEGDRAFVPASRFARITGIEYNWTAPVATFYGK